MKKQRYEGFQHEMKEKISELNSLLNQVIQEKKYLQNEINKISMKNTELLEENEKNRFKIPEEYKELEVKVRN